jgi:hypothetical protein
MVIAHARFDIRTSIGSATLPSPQAAADRDDRYPSPCDDRLASSPSFRTGRSGALQWQRLLVAVLRGEISV